MKKIIVIGYLLTVNSVLFAHPGIGIVKDSKGNIFYTDLKQVWKISQGGDRAVVVNGVHPYQQFIVDHL